MVYRDVKKIAITALATTVICLLQVHLQTMMLCHRYRMGSQESRIAMLREQRLVLTSHRTQLQTTPKLYEALQRHGLLLEAGPVPVVAVTSRSRTQRQLSEVRPVAPVAWFSRSTVVPRWGDPPHQ